MTHEHTIADEPIKNSLTLTTNFKNLEEGDFTVDASSQQAKMKVGDPRWLVDFVAPDVTDAKAALKTEIDAATALLGNADITVDPAKTLKEAIDAAQRTYETAEFNELLTAATTTLKVAEEKSVVRRVQDGVTERKRYAAIHRDIKRANSDGLCRDLH